MSDSNKPVELLHAKLNLETSQMRWQELLRYFAGGAVVAVSEDLDLIEVAICVANDDAAAVAQWMAEQKVAKATDAQAAAWLEEDAVMWTVVVKPWVLVQQDRRPAKLH